MKIDLQKIIINQDILEMIDEPFAKNKGVILFEKNKLAMLDPNDLETLEFIKVKLNAQVEPYLITSKSLKFALKMYKKRPEEKVELRFHLSELGLSPPALKIVEEGIKKTSGIFLVTGPVGAGKTATLCSLVKQNPKIIMMGEIRDSENMDLAINSALSGHLVLVTLRAHDAITAISMLLDMNVPASLLSSALNTIVAQRLVRRICNVCVNGGDGCQACGFSQYLGKMGIFEVLNVSEAIKDLIIHQAPALEIKKKAREEGMITMLEDGLAKAKAGITTREEVLKKTS